LSLNKWGDVGFYIEQFINNRFIPADVTDLKEHIKGLNLDGSEYVFAMKYAGGKQQIVIGSPTTAQGTNFISLSKGGPRITDKQRTQIATMLGKMYMNTSVQAMTKNKAVGVITADGAVTTKYSDYKELIKASSAVPFIGMEYTDEQGETKKAYGVQALITINVDDHIEGDNKESRKKIAKVKHKQEKAVIGLTYKDGVLRRKLKQYGLLKIANQIKDNPTVDHVDPIIGAFEQINDIAVFGITEGWIIEELLEELEPLFSQLRESVVFKEFINENDVVRYLTAFINAKETISIADLINHNNTVITLTPTQKSLL